MARLWAGAEQEDERVEREKREGMRPDSKPIKDEDITPKMALVENGIVVDTLIDVHGQADAEDGVTAVKVESFSDLVVGAPLPWPRAKRDALLTACDWTQQPDLQAQKTVEWKLAWSAYRQALRDLPEAFPDPSTIEWPEQPQN